MIHVTIKDMGERLQEASLLVDEPKHVGDLTSEVNVKDGDTTSLLFAIKKMRDSLVGIVGRVKEGTHAIEQASTEIATGNLDFSSRTEQQAGALEETASAMEELMSTVKQNADSAKQASDLAMSASNVATRGGEVVGKVIYENRIKSKR